MRNENTPMKRSWVGIVLLLGVLWGAVATAQATALTLVKEFEVQPGRAYALSFESEVRGNVAEDTQWVVHMRDSQGRLPFDGALAGEWQKIHAKPDVYQHRFYAPAEVSRLQLYVRQAGGDVALRNVKLEPIRQDNLVINGDFSAGEDNYSGWNERYNAQLTRRVEAKGESTVLRVAQNGYVLTDYIPVEAGGKYLIRAQQGVSGFTMLAYDGQRRYLETINQPVTERGRLPFEMPSQAAYIRVLYETGHDHLPTWRQNDVANLQLLVSELPANLSRLDNEVCTDWEIVLAPGSDAREEHAARELRHWMAQITGKKALLLAEPSLSKTRKIFVGLGWATAFAEDLREIEGTDGYAVRSKDGNIYVFGVRPRGTFYGVHALLERNTDIIWPRPNPEFEAFFSKQPKLELTVADFRSLPIFEKRHISRAGHHNSHLVFQRWNARNALNSPWSLHTGNRYLIWRDGAQLGYMRAYLTLVDSDDEKIRPLIDGQRDPSRWRHPCFTYPGTVKEMVAGIRRAMETLPGQEIEHFSASIEDNWLVCTCPDCLSPIILPDGQKLEARSQDASRDPLFFSTRNTLMLNKVAEEVSKDYPDLKIESLAYIFTAEPPKVPVHPMIMPQYAAYPTKNERYPILSGKGQQVSIYDKEIWKRRFEQWGDLKKGELGIFGYYYTSGYNALADTAAEDFRALAKYEAVQAMTEGFAVDTDEPSIWDADAIEKWVISKLMWDPYQDPNALRKEYIRRVYRGAEKEMTEFYRLIHDSWHGAPENVFVNCHSSARDLFQNLIVAQGIEEPMKKSLESALLKATDPQVKAIIQRHITYFNGLAATMGRYMVPRVEEASHEWNEIHSIHWEKAVVIDDFLKVSDWRDFDKAPSAHPTRVSAMHDGKNLYVRFIGKDDNLAGVVRPAEPAGELFPNGDRFEFRLQNAAGREYYFALGAGRHFYVSPFIPGGWETGVVAADKDSWGVVMVIPLELAGTAEQRKAFKVRLGRVYRMDPKVREESSSNGASIFNPHPSFWLNFQLEGL